jgi:hypothetical protein
VAKNLKIIANNCKQAPFTYNLSELVSFTGSLLKSTPEQLQKCRTSLIDLGMQFPVYVWLNKGKPTVIHREVEVQVLRELELAKFKIDPVPCVLVKANNVAQAKELALLSESHYGQIVKRGFQAFSEGLNLKQIANYVHFPELKLQVSSVKTISDNIDNTVVEFMYLESNFDKLDEYMETLSAKYKTKDRTKIVLRALKEYINRVK